MVSVFWFSVKSGARFFLRMLSPLSSMRWALWTIRSRIASAMVGSPIMACHPDTGSWAVMMVDRRW